MPEPKTMAPPERIKCYRCGGWCYVDLVGKKPEAWCILCAEWQRPADFKPLPYVATVEDKYDEDSWYIDEHGDIIDAIDRKIESLIEKSASDSFNVSYVAKAVHCSNYEARSTLDRLARHGKLEQYRYGPQSRWTAYRKVDHATY